MVTHTAIPTILICTTVALTIPSGHLIRSYLREWGRRSWEVCPLRQSQQVRKMSLNRYQFHVCALWLQGQTGPLHSTVYFSYGGGEMCPPKTSDSLIIWEHYRSCSKGTTGPGPQCKSSQSWENSRCSHKTAYSSHLSWFKYVWPL